MDKNTSVSKAKKNREKVIENERKEIRRNEIVESNNPFDFGGLPIKDIKKNLGCG